MVAAKGQARVLDSLMDGSGHRLIMVHKEHDTLSTGEVNEGIEEPKPEIALPEAAALTELETGRPPELFWLRWAYALEFLIAIVAIITLWGEVGGEGHLDLIPWYTKLAGILGWSWCCVGFTAGMVEQKKVWSARTIRWFLGIILLTAAMGVITYYYHLHEEPDEGSDDTTASSVSTLAPGGTQYVASYRTSG